MSDTSSSPPTPAEEQQAANNSLWTPQTVVALSGIIIVAGTIAGVFWKGDAPTLQLVVGLVIGGYGSGIYNFYFGSSKGSQDKDTTSARVQEKLATTAATVATGVPPVQQP